MGISLCRRVAVIMAIEFNATQQHKKVLNIHFFLPKNEEIFIGDSQKQMSRY